MIRTIYRCEVCKAIFEICSTANEHKVEHIKKGDVWSAECKLNGNPSSGLCIDKNLYDRCSPPVANNWMCWRDGILITYDRLHTGKDRLQ